MTYEPDAEESAWSTDRRRDRTLKDWAVIIALVINVSGLVWSAAKSSAALEQLQVGQTRNSLIIERAITQLNAIDVRLSIVEAMRASDIARKEK